MSDPFALQDSYGSHKYPAAIAGTHLPTSDIDAGQDSASHYLSLHYSSVKAGQQ